MMKSIQWMNKGGVRVVYKGLNITTGFYGVEVIYNGSEFLFDTVEDAREFIDGIKAEK